MKTFLEAEQPIGTTGGTIRHDGVAGRAFGHDFFKCTNDIFQDCLHGRAKNKKWNKFVGRDKTLSDNIRSYIKDNKKSKFLLQNERTGEFVFADQRFNIKI